MSSQFYIPGNLRRLGRFRGLLDWLEWGRVTLCCWPKVTSRTTSPRKTAELAIEIHKSGYIVRQQHSASSAFPAPVLLDLHQIEQILSELPRSQTLTLEVASGRYLRRRLADKALPFGRAVIVADLDTVENVPFLREGTYILLPTLKPGREMSYFIIRRAVLDPLMEICRRSDLSIGAIRLASENGYEPISRASVHMVVPVTRSRFRRSAALTGVTATLLALLGATFAHVYFRNASAIDQLDQRLSAKQVEAMKITRIIGGRAAEAKLYQAVDKAKSSAVAVTKVWEELTRTLPDNTWLTDFSVRNEQVSISGFSNSAADLIPALGASSQFTNPAFTSPVMRIPGQQGERFSIDMRVKRQ